MLILYAISVVSFCALVWAAIAITRHIRLASSTASTSTESAPKAAPPKIVKTSAKSSKTNFAGNPGSNSKQPQPR